MAEHPDVDEALDGDAAPLDFERKVWLFGAVAIAIAVAAFAVFVAPQTRTGGPIPDPDVLLER